MKVNGKAWRSIWTIGTDALSAHLGIVDQTRLPFAFETLTLTTCAQVVNAIERMQLRGAPLIGVAGAYGLALALRESATDAALNAAFDQLLQSRPTAVNLRWALERVRAVVAPLPQNQRAVAAWHEAGALAEEDVALNRALGAHGAQLLAQLQARTGKPLNILTHCNTGWIATVDYGTALSAIYQAFDADTPLHVWVSETRPRNQGLLTAWELAAHGVPHTLIADNASGHLMQHGQVDVVLVGADRVSPRGDVCNKIGTYLKAVAAFDNHVPFYAAVPSPTIDWTWVDAQAHIPIEARSGDEVRLVQGTSDGPSDAAPSTVRIASAQTAVLNPAFDITPARLVTGLITERGLVALQADPHALTTQFSAR